MRSPRRAASGSSAAERLKDDDPPKQTEIQKKTDLALTPPTRIKPGDTLLIEVLEALPGRPISGERMVRPDGTISLGFYGDLKVAGLDRNEIKVKVVEHLTKWLPDEVLGLEEPGPDGKIIKVAPVDSDRVFVDDNLGDGPKPVSFPPGIGPATTVKPGDFLAIEVLKALPGRPISGMRLVRPDGTISLGFYGDVNVTGLNRKEVKIKVIEHLTKWLPDEDLGLKQGTSDGKTIKIAPADSIRVFVDESPTYVSPRPLNFPSTTGPTMVVPGDFLLIEALETLPGRPLSGVRLVRPDGSISLGWYGDLNVAGMTRQEIKVKVVERLQKYLPDEVLGLKVTDPKTGKTAKVNPVDTDRVFVEDDLKYWPEPTAEQQLQSRRESMSKMQEQIDRLTREVEELKRGKGK